MNLNELDLTGNNQSINCGPRSSYGLEGQSGNTRYLKRDGLYAMFSPPSGNISNKFFIKSITEPLELPVTINDVKSAMEMVEYFTY